MSESTSKLDVSEVVKDQTEFMSSELPHSALCVGGPLCHLAHFHRHSHGVVRPAGRREPPHPLDGGEPGSSLDR